MGVDGHTASWFPSAAGVDEALDAQSEKLVVPVRPKPSGGTGDYLERGTFTLSALRDSGPILLMLSGHKKMSVYLDIVADPSSDVPIRKLIDAYGKRLTIYWAP